MPTAHNNRWQDKIDPAFDSMIKTHVGFLENCEELPNGDLSLNEEFKKMVLNNPGWHSAYVEDRLLFKIVS